MAWGNTADTEALYLLWRKITTRFAKKNRLLFKTLFPDDASVLTIIKKIITVDWEARFVPLEFGEILPIWMQLLRKNIVHSTENLSYNIVHLADQYLITFDGIPNSKPHRIDPFAFASLGNFILDSYIRSSLSQQIQEFISKGADEVAKLASNSRIDAAGGVAVVQWHVDALFRRN